MCQIFLRTKLNIGEALREGTKSLVEAGIDEAEINAEYLLAHALSVDRLRLTFGRTEELGGKEMGNFREFLARRINREPLQYIVGTVNFMGLTLNVDRRVLIPRPETENLVQEALSVLRAAGKESPRVLDIGTGSGNIALAIACHVPHAEITGMDCSGSALRVARGNAEELGLEDIRFVSGDVLDDFLPGERFDLIVGNPPYVSRDEFEGLQPEIRLFEPRLAITDEADGLRFIRRIVHLSPDRLRPGGTLLLELGFGQSEKAAASAKKAGLANVHVRDDLNGVPRVLVASRRDE